MKPGMRKTYLELILNQGVSKKSKARKGAKTANHKDRKEIKQKTKSRKRKTGNSSKQIGKANKRIQKKEGNRDGGKNQKTAKKAYGGKHL